MADIVVLGSLNMDLVVRTERIPRPGETISGKAFRTIPGGKGANQAAAAARLGASVAMVGCVGGDAFGPVLLENMRQQGVDATSVRTDPDAATGIAMILVDASGENVIVVAPGANGALGPEDLATCDRLLDAAQYLVLQFEVPMSVVREAIALAQQHGVRVILNPAPAQPVDAELLRGVYALVVNETEAEAITRQPVDDIPSVEAAGIKILHRGVPVAIITLGARGAFVATANHKAHVPAHHVEVVDTTAAGDAFVGGLATAFVDGREIVEAVRFASCAGTLAATKLGAQTSLPSAAEVRALYDLPSPRSSYGD